MNHRPRFLFIILIIFLFFFRTIYGLVAEFWFEDELQIYLIGLKSYTSQTWPYYGPDVVYTNTQIPGALQGLLVSAGFYIFPVPESPTIVLNILSFLSLSFFAWYISKRIPTLPAWLVWAWVMTLTWSMNYSTRVVNPSYVLIFSIPFCIALFELLPIYKSNIVSRKLSFFLLGLMPPLIMQLHLSFVLLFPFIALVFFGELRRPGPFSGKTVNGFIFLLGAMLGLSTVLPTWLLTEDTKSISSNVVFNLDNIKNIVTILMRYLSFASYEIPYMLGGNTTERMNVIRYNIWMAPFAIYLLSFGFLLIGAFVFVFFKKKGDGEWKKIKWLALLGFVLVFFSFFFSIKGPSSHTFYVFFPLPVLYSFYCYEWLWNKYKIWKHLMHAALLCCLFFYTGAALYNYKHKSLYKDRQKVVEAINKKDYKILGERRADKWGYGY